ncbi:MAG: fused MFS/spermidine synthase [Phycisphaerae bacterium]|nr:fused MFS/spermidine synthase [Phycisphaerae bacterium]
MGSNKTNHVPGSERRPPDLVESPASDRSFARFRTMCVPCATAFVASACVMVVEILAGRQTARYLGSSNYTWTSIIAVVLGGLAAGYYVGGRLADRYRTGPTLSILFVLSAVGCFFVPMVNNWVGEWSALWLLTWPHRIFTHVMLTFTLPAMLLGTIGPVVAKMALERSTVVGRTMGDVYAWGAVGSIIGTVACGFYFIPHFGIQAINHTVAGILAFMAVLYGVRHWLAYAWAAISVLVLCTAVGPWEWAQTRGEELGLREADVPGILFHHDSEYAQVRVVEVPDNPGERALLLDKLVHTMVNVNKPDELIYGYHKVFAAVTEHVAAGRGDINVLVFGGGGYAHPRHILNHWPNSSVEVVEIDRVVTDAAVEAFGLRLDEPRLKVVSLDGRQYLADLVRRKDAGEDVRDFNFIFLDVFNDFSIPYHLTTREFLGLVDEVLAPDGVYMAILIDILDVGRFLGAMLNTAGQAFEYTACFFTNDAGRGLDPRERNTFVIVASHRDLHLDRLAGSPTADEVRGQRLSDDQVRDLLRRVDGLVLTDDHAPVEYLLTGVVQQSGKNAYQRFYNRGNIAMAEGRYEDAIADYRKAIELNPAFRWAHMNLGISLYELRRHAEALQSFQTAARLRPDEPEPHFNVGNALMVLGDYESAVEAFQKAVAIRPDYAMAYDSLGMALGNLGRMEEARGAFLAALKADPNHAAARQHLAKLEAALLEAGG